MKQSDGRETSAPKGSSGADTGDRSAAGSFSWQRLRPAFLSAFAEGRAVAFCEVWLDQLILSYEELTSEERRHDPPHPGLPWLNETRDSLLLLLQWWLPSRTEIGSRDAVRALRKRISNELLAYVAIVGFPDGGDGNAASLRVLGRRIDKLRFDEAFLTAVAVQLATYDPTAESSPSPDAAMHAAIQAELERNLGHLMLEIRTNAAVRPVPNRRALGDELRRRLALPITDHQRGTLEAALAQLERAERECIIRLYGEGGGYKKTEGLSGRRIQELRESGIQKLLKELPDLTEFLASDASRRFL